MILLNEYRKPLTMSDDHSDCILKTLTVLQSYPSIAFWTLCEALQQKVVGARDRNRIVCTHIMAGICDLVSQRVHTSFVFVDVCCLFVKLCLLCFKESRILSTLWNGKHWIQRGQRFDLWTQVSRILVRRVSSRAKMVSVRAPEESRNTFPCDAMIAAGRRFADIPEDMKEKAPFVEHCELNLNISVQQGCVVFFSYKLTPSHLVLLARWPKIGPISWRPLQMLMMSLQRQGM